MEEKSGMKKRPSVVSARPAVRASGGRGQAAPASAGPPTQVQAQPAIPAVAEKTPMNEGDGTPASPNVKSYIERQLKSVYDDVLNQPIPDRFLELLNALDQSPEGAKPKSEDKA